MKILILSNNVDGLYLFRKELILNWVESQKEVVTALPAEGDFLKLKSLGCRVIEVSMERRGMNPLKDIRLFYSYLRILKREKPNIVLTYTIKPNIYGGIACRFLKIPYIMNITGLGTAIKNGGILARFLLSLYSVSAKKAKRVFFQNKENMDFMLQHSIASNNHGLLPGSGVNIKEHSYVPYPSEEKGIGFLGVFRIMKDKGIEEYLELIKVMMEEKGERKLIFSLVGEYEPETKDYYKPQIDSFVKKGWLKYYGYSEQVPEIMGQHHVVVHPSYHEGMSNVLLEAASCGRPIVASNISGCKETFIEGKTGIGFCPSDVGELIKAVKEILDKTEEERMKMGREGRTYIEKKFDRGLILKAYQEEIEKIK